MKQAVVLAGGKGTRLAPYTAVFPKPLMPIGDAPIIDMVLHQLATGGFERVVLAVGYLAELIEAFCGDGSRYGLSIEYCREESPLGTAGPLAEIGGLGTEPFLVLNGDVLSLDRLRGVPRAARRIGRKRVHRDLQAHRPRRLRRGDRRAGRPSHRLCREA